jgi:hypothetical protein
MTDAGSVLLDRAQSERAFTALGERLARRGVVADVFVVGGAAMALAYDATRVTRDVDSLFVPHGIVSLTRRSRQDHLPSSGICSDKPSGISRALEHSQILDHISPDPVARSARRIVAATMCGL